jgi:hypothetical protein
MKDREKELKVVEQKLLMGKQGIIDNLLNVDINKSKKEVDQELMKNKNMIATYSLVIDLIVMVMGLFEIDRFKKEKCRVHNRVFLEIASIQVEFARLEK